MFVFTFKLNSSPNALYTNLNLPFMKVIKKLKTIQMPIRNKNIPKTELVYNNSEHLKQIYEKCVTLIHAFSQFFSSNTAQQYFALNTFCAASSLPTLQSN